MAAVPQRPCRRVIAGLSSGALGVALGAAPSAADAGAAEVTLGPEVSVTGGEAFNHWESALVVDPSDPRRLLVSSNTHNVEGAINDPSRWTGSTYSSTDGGLTWRSDGRISDKKPLGDALVDLGPDGAAVAAALWRTDGGRCVALWRSDELGASWGEELLTEPRGADYEKSVFDCTGGPYHGRYYVHFRAARGELRLIGLELPTAGGMQVVVDRAYDTEHAGFADNPLVLSDATLFLPFRSKKTILTDEKGYAGGYADYYCRTSKDGGETFTPRVHIVRDESKRGVEVGGGPPVYGAGPVQGGERVYLVWLDNSAGRAAMWLMTSDDQGATWSRKVDILPEHVPGGMPSVPSLAVSPEGIVGISWLSHEGAGYQPLFMASTDGGKTWTQPVALASAKSGRAAYDARYPGGDYTFFDAAEGGVFHPIWQDVREGEHYQIYTRKVTVIPAEAAAAE